MRKGLQEGYEEPIETVPQRFFLTVGSVGSRKNQLRSIEAFAQSRLADEGFRYVVCGAPEPGFELVLEAAGKILGVILLGYLNDSRRRWLGGVGLQIVRDWCCGSTPRVRMAL